MKLATHYLGLKLAHPIIASASPLSRTLDGIRRLEDAGAAAIVMPSIYEEEIAAEDEAYEQLVEQGSLTQPEAEGYFPPMTAFRVGGLEARLETLRRAAEACAIPIIASLNGSTPRGWTGFAHELEQAGASGIELNIYRVPTDLHESGAEVEARWIETVGAAANAVSVPVSVKLGPWLSSPAHFARSLVLAGARGLVLFNRFYQPDIDLETLWPTPTLELSHPYEIRQALLWISMLSGRVDASLAATGGVDSADEVVKYLLAGADVVMTASALLRHGPEHIATLKEGLVAWMESRGFDDVAALRGQISGGPPGEREPLVRAQYIDVLTSYQLPRR